MAQATSPPYNLISYPSTALRTGLVSGCFKHENRSTKSETNLSDDSQDSKSKFSNIQKAFELCAQGKFIGLLLNCSD